MNEEMNENDGVIVQAAPARPNAAVMNTFSDSDESRKLVFNATSSADSLNNHMNKVIVLKGAFLTQGVRRGFDNMPDVDCINTYLVDDKGNAYFSQSTGVARDMANLIALYNNNIEGVKIKIGERELSGGRRLKYVKIVD